MQPEGILTLCLMVISLLYARLEFSFATSMYSLQKNHAMISVSHDYLNNVIACGKTFQFVAP